MQNGPSDYIDSQQELAERVGFEPTVRLPVQRFRDRSPQLRLVRAAILTRLQVPATNLRQLVSVPIWYVLEQIQSPQPPTVDSRRVFLRGAFFYRPCRKIPGFRPSPHRGERRVPWPASRGRDSTRSTSLRTRRISPQHSMRSRRCGRRSCWSSAVMVPLDRKAAGGFWIPRTAADRHSCLERLEG